MRTFVSSAIAIAASLLAAMTFFAPVSPAASTASAGTGSAGAATLTWHRGRFIEQARLGYGPLQCVSSTWCMDLDSVGLYFLYDGDKWSRPQHLLRDAAVLTCVSRSFCLAENLFEDDFRSAARTARRVDEGFLERWNGTSWTHVAQLSVSRNEALSCGAITLCAVADGNRGVVDTFSAKNYRTTRFRPTRGWIDSVTCSGPSFCLAVGHKTRAGDGSAYGQAWTFDGSTWSRAGTFDSAEHFESVSCGTPTSCAALDDAGHLDTWNGAEWSTTMVPAHGTLPDGSPYGEGNVSCVGPSFCMAVDGAAGAHTFDGSAWSNAADPGTGLSGVRGLDCVRATWCMVDDAGATTVWDGATWSAPTDHILAPPSYVRAVSCPTTSFCAAFDDIHPITFGPHGFHEWPDQRFFADVFRSKERAVDVSCTSRTFCMIVAGHVWTRFNGSSWTPVAHLGPGSWSQVSCPTDTFCSALNSDGQAAQWNGSSWSDPMTVLPRAASGLSCPSASYCLATDVGGAVVSYTHGQWNPYRTNPVGTRVIRISCVSAQFCVGTVNTRTRHGGVVVRRNGHWGAIHQVGEFGLTDLDCVTTTFCAGISAMLHGLGGGMAYVFNGKVWTGSKTREDDRNVDISCATNQHCVATYDELATIGTR